MANHEPYSAPELGAFMHKLDGYEPGIPAMIQQFMPERNEHEVLQRLLAIIDGHDILALAILRNCGFDKLGYKLDLAAVHRINALHARKFRFTLYKNYQNHLILEMMDIHYEWTEAGMTEQGGTGPISSFRYEFNLSTMQEEVKVQLYEATYRNSDVADVNYHEVAEIWVKSREQELDPQTGAVLPSSFLVMTKEPTGFDEGYTTRIKTGPETLEEVARYIRVYCKNVFGVQDFDTGADPARPLKLIARAFAPLLVRTLGDQIKHNTAVPATASAYAAFHAPLSDKQIDEATYILLP